MSYVDGYVLAVPRQKREAYKRLASQLGPVFVEHGAVEVVECWGDDVPAGVLTSFSMAVKAEPEEVVVFSWIRWPSREVREQGMERALNDPRVKGMPRDVFDGARMIFGGFEELVAFSAPTQA